MICDVSSDGMGFTNLEQANLKSKNEDRKTSGDRLEMERARDAGMVSTVNPTTWIGAQTTRPSSATAPPVREACVEGKRRERDRSRDEIDEILSEETRDQSRADQNTGL